MILHIKIITLKKYKMKKVLIIMLFLGTLVSFGQEKKNKNAKATFEINGNCEHCKQRIEKASYAISGVKMATWSMETHQLSVIFNEEKTSASNLKKAIAKVGHDSDEEKSTPETYEKLPGCCQYERKK